MLRRWVGGEGAALNSASVGSADQCALGQWLKTEAAEEEGTPAYDDLLTSHAEFHRWAAEIVKRVENGEDVGAMMAAEGQFEAKSRKIISAFSRLKKNSARV